MVWEPWLRTERLTLARYANPHAAACLPPTPADFPNPTDIRSAPDGTRMLVRLIYERLLGCSIQYALEPFNYEQPQQLIRPPFEILYTTHEATCLDLALLFSSICLHYELVPLLVLLKGHALIAVSRTQFRRDLEQDGYAEQLLFDAGVLEQEKADRLCDLVDRGAYLMLECTGMAYSTSLSRDRPEGQGRTNGRMTFERAIQAGREQLDLSDRCFLYALNLHDIQRHSPPFPIHCGAELQEDIKRQLIAVKQHWEGVTIKLATPYYGSGFAAGKRKALQRRLDARREEYDAVMMRIDNIVDPIIQMRLQRSAEALEQEIKEIEADVQKLEDE